MSLRKLANRLQQVQIPNLEEIAKSTDGADLQDYTRNFAHNIVEARVKALGVKYDLNGKSDAEFLYRLKEDEWAFVGIAPFGFEPDNKNAAIKKYIRAVNAQTTNVAGVIQFVPFQLVKRGIRDRVSREAPVSFLDLQYNNQSMERRFRDYS